MKETGSGTCPPVPPPPPPPGKGWVNSVSAPAVLTFMSLNSQAELPVKASEPDSVPPLAITNPPSELPLHAKLTYAVVQACSDIAALTPVSEPVTEVAPPDTW